MLEVGEQPFDLPLDELFDQDGQPIESAPHATMTVLLKTERPLKTRGDPAAPPAARGRPLRGVSRSLVELAPSHGAAVGRGAGGRGRRIGLSLLDRLLLDPGRLSRSAARPNGTAAVYSTTRERAYSCASAMYASCEWATLRATASASSVRTTLPGTPTTKEHGGIT